METIYKYLEKYAPLFLRMAIGTAFLSAVADRFGIWGVSGEPGIAWGNFNAFLEYVALLNPYLPSMLISPLGWFVTILETVFGIMLIAGFKIRLTALFSGILLLTFAIAMAFTSGIKSPLDYSVFTASAGALLLSLQNKSQFSLD